MKKSNIGLLVIAVLLLVVSISLSTFAVYKSSVTGTASADVASWIVKVNGNDMVTNETFTFDSNDIVWENNDNVKEGKIVPGSKGKIEFEIDASESEVTVDYVVELDTNSINNDNITVSTEYKEGTIEYSKTASDMTKTITIDVVWDAVDNDGANENDVALAGKKI